MPVVTVVISGTSVTAARPRLADLKGFGPRLMERIEPKTPSFGLAWPVEAPPQPASRRKSQTPDSPSPKTGCRARGADLTPTIGADPPGESGQEVAGGSAWRKWTWCVERPSPAPVSPARRHVANSSTKHGTIQRSERVEARSTKTAPRSSQTHE
jgi:hypothetical protein